MKRYAGLVPFLLILFLMSCGEKPKPCPKCPPVPTPPDSLAYDDMRIDATVASTSKPHKIKMKWKYGKTYRMCINVTVKNNEKIAFIVHRANGDQIIIYNTPAGHFSSRHLNRLLLFQGYITVQVTKANGTVEYPEVKTDTSGASNCGPLDGERDSCSSTSSSGSTIAVTVDEI